ALLYCRMIYYLRRLKRTLGAFSTECIEQFNFDYFVKWYLVK
ncbi:unnamed protein product, partial [marine sediment metagenome]